MPFKDLRDFLDKLREMKDFVELRETENGYEVSALGWEFPTVVEAQPLCLRLKAMIRLWLLMSKGTLQRNAIALGLDPTEIIERNFVILRNHMAKALESKNTWIEPKVVKSGPCQEVVFNR